MRRLIAFVSLVSLATAMAAAQSKGASSAESEIITLEHTFDQAGAKNDAATLDRLMADDCAVTYFVPPKLMTKAEFLESVKGPQRYTVTASSLDNLKVQLHGDTAIVTGTWKETRKMSTGETVMISGRLTDVWLKLSGQWKLEASHASADGPPKS